MVAFERALVSSYKLSIYILFLCQQSFVRNFRLQFSVGVENPQFWGRGGRRGSGMVPFEKALVSSSSYKPSIHTIPLSALVCPKFYIAVLSGGCEPQGPNFWEGEAVEGGGWYHSKEYCGVPISSPYTYYSSISTRLPEILDCSFQWGLRTPDFGEGEAVGGRGWYRPKERW